jgi:probable HAF family extracellular repeat protein
MRINLVRTLLAAALSAAIIYAQSPGPSIAGNRTPVRYIVKDLGPFPGGTFSYAAGIADNGLVAGRANGKAGASDSSWHAVLWLNGRAQPMDIATPGLGGRNSEAFGVNESGQVSGTAETSQLDPNGEDFCGFGAQGLPYTGHTCRAFLWQYGVMTALPTLGGANAAGGQINNRGEVVGFGETLTKDPDPACPVHQFKPVMWANGKAQELKIPTNSDLEGAAYGINDSGQVVGGSGTCMPFSVTGQTYLNPVHALLWENGGVTDLGNLTGQTGSQAGAINNRGQVIGSSGLYGFLWTRATGMRPLMPLAGDFLSAPLAIDESGGVVTGLSIDGSFSVLSAVVWENGASVPVNLNDRLIDNAGLYLQLAEGINSGGEIVGFAQPLNSPLETRGFVAIPVTPTADDNFSSAEQSAMTPAALSEYARKLLQERPRFSGFGTRPIRPR